MKDNTKDKDHYLYNFEERRFQTLEFMEQNNIRIRHFKSQLNNPFGGISVAYQHDPRNSFVKISTSVCSAKDQFNTKIGRVLAIENFMNQKTICLPYSKKIDDMEINYFIGSIFSYFNETWF